MDFRQKIILIFPLIVHYSGTVLCETPVVISEGSITSEVKGVTLYDDVEFFHHFIPDLPNPPKSVVQPCPTGATKKSCDLSSHIHKILEDNVMVQELLNLARTSYGLSTEDFPDAYVNASDLRPVEERGHVSDGPSDDLTKLLPEKWLSEVRLQLMEREPTIAVNRTLTLLRSRRFAQYIKPLIIGTSAILGADELVDMVSSLFVGENGVLKFLTNSQLSRPDQSFVDLSRRISEFESRTRLLTEDIIVEAQAVQRTTESLQQDVARQKSDLQTLEDSNIVSLQLLSDSGSIMFAYGIYFTGMNADMACRDGVISPIYLPPHLLSEKLYEVELFLPTELRLAIRPDNVQPYYTTKLASCMFDSKGGLLTVTVPVVLKTADYKLFENRNLFFAWEEQTCVLESASRYVIKDVKNNRVFPIETIDDQKCSPELTKMCKVPPASDDAESYCLNQLLSSSTVSQVRESCPIKCFDKKDTIVTQLNDMTFVGVHVTKNTLSVECENHPPLNITDEVPYGSLRIVTQCACVVKLRGSTVGRSRGPICAGHETTAVHILLPAHWTTLDDYLVWVNDQTTDGLTFQHIGEIFNTHAMDHLNKTEKSFLTAEVHVIGVSAAIGLLALTSARLVEAHESHYCRLEPDVYHLLYILIFICSCTILPAMLYNIYKFFKGLFWQAVDVETGR